jgi:hypothetical protein
VGLINYNGRIYDPQLGRFLSADPYVHDPTNTQSLNRYTYAQNNPLAFNDPTGYFSLGDFFSDLFKAIVTLFTDPAALFGIVAAVTLNFWALPALEGEAFAKSALGAVVNAGISGGVAGAIATGNVKGALIGAVTAAAFAEVGNLTSPLKGESTGAYMHSARFAENVVGHAVVGCASGVAAGGQCGPGAFAGGVTALAGPMLPDPETMRGAIIDSSVVGVIGGTASALGGGKFENGFATGAFGYLFNDALHPNNKMTSGWGQNGFDPDQWQLVGTTTGDPLTFTAGDQIGVLASSSAGPLPTNQFWFSVNAQGLNQYGGPIPSLLEAYDTPTLYSSGPTGNGSANPFVFQAVPPGSVPTSGYRWTVGIPPQEDAHGNYDYNTLRVYVPKPLTQ